jgi:tetratricopeptide (TPR) repeat protein
VKRLVSVFALLATLCGAATTSHAADAKPAKADAKPATMPAAVDSLAILEHAVAKDSTKFDNLYKLGIMYLDREKNAEAAKVFSKANRVKPKNVKVLVNLGVALDNLSQAEAAQGYYREAIAIAPMDSLASCRLATSLYAQGKFPEAMTLLRDLIAKQPRSHCAYFTMGVAFADAGLYRDAIRMWKKVVDLAPASAEAQSAKESIDVLERFLSGQ